MEKERHDWQMRIWKYKEKVEIGLNGVGLKFPHCEWEPQVW